MAGSKFFRNKTNRIIHKTVKSILITEKKLIQIKYKFIKCNISNNKLVCTGKIKPTDTSDEYEFKIIYDVFSSPSVYATNPKITYHEDIHLFPKDNSLCLYHSKTDNFNWDYKKHRIYNTIIPWMTEWFVYYEIYLISGKWEHPFVSHRSTKSNI